MAELEQIFREKAQVDSILQAIKRSSKKQVTIMEVCGTHTMSIFRHGLRSILPDKIRLVSGPGCPVCVTSQTDIDRMISLAETEEVIVATFGDLLRVPGSNTSLLEARARGARVEIVYSPAEALTLSRKNPEKRVVFLGVGFETTAPTVAATILQAHAEGLRNFFVYSCHKVMPPALNALFEDETLTLQGLLCPGHVSTIIGTKAYEPLCSKFRIPCVIAGFEPVDILAGILLILRQTNNGRAQVENCYTRAVTREGNKRARQLMDKVFSLKPAQWRGLGTIDSSGLAIRDEFSHLDAEKHFDISVTDSKGPKGCICGQIIRAKASPTDCPLFATRCTPTSPVGPCMVSSEGTCSAYYRYGDHDKKRKDTP